MKPKVKMGAGGLRVVREPLLEWEERTSAPPQHTLSTDRAGMVLKSAGEETEWFYNIHPHGADAPAIIGRFALLEPDLALARAVATAIFQTVVASLPE